MHYIAFKLFNHFAIHYPVLHFGVIITMGAHYKENWGLFNVLGPNFVVSFTDEKSQIHGGSHA